jgi:hypothetical protein
VCDFDYCQKGDRFGELCFEEKKRKWLKSKKVKRNWQDMHDVYREDG